MISHRSSITDGDVHRASSVAGAALNAGLGIAFDLENTEKIG